MPEYVILISAIACAGAGVTLYFNRNNVPALAIAIVGVIALLYGVGQYFERDNVEARALGFADAADRRAAQSAGTTDAETWKRQQSQPVQPAQLAQPPQPPRTTSSDTPKKPDDEATARRQAQAEADRLEALGSQFPNVQFTPSDKVTLTNFASQRTANRYLEISGTVVNRNEFAIKNVVVRCGDKSYASGDVSATVDQVVPARSDIRITAVRMGPINPALPPTICLIAKFDRAN